MILKIKEASTLFNKLNSFTRFFIKISLIMIFTLIISSVFAYFSPHIQNSYDLIFLPEQLIQCAKSILGVGCIGSFLLMWTEK